MSDQSESPGSQVVDPDNENTVVDEKNNINTAIKFNLLSIKTELAERAVKKAEDAYAAAKSLAKSEERDLNWFYQFFRRGGEIMLKPYSTDTLEEAVRIKEGESQHGSGRNKRITRTKNKSKINRMKIKSKKRTKRNKQKTKRRKNHTKKNHARKRR